MLESIKNILLIFIFSVLFISPSFSLELSFKGAMDSLKNKIDRQRTIKIGGETVIEDIYYSSLDKIQSDELLPVFYAISKTTQYFNNNQYCQLTDSDIATILYFANSAFKRDLLANLKNFIPPTLSDLGVSCDKFSICKNKNSEGKLTKGGLVELKLNNTCKADVSKVFIQLQANSNYIENLGSSYKNTAFFWNGSLEDSSFDIVYDIYMLAQILFQDVKKPAQIPFFHIPVISNNTTYHQSELNMKIDWFSPYNIYTITQTDSTPSDHSTTTVGEVVGEGSSEQSEKPTNPNNSNSINQYIDSSVVEFIESMTLNMSNPGFSVAGNQCVSGFSVDDYEISVNREIVTASEYLETILEDMNNASCNNDRICQTWEGLSCVDCSTNQGIGDFDMMAKIIKDMMEGVDGGGSGGGGSYDLNNPSSDYPNLSCLQKCEPLPCNPLNCDKLICYAKCFCQEYEASLNTDGFAGLSNAFKIRFCPIPAVGVEPKKVTTVYNIYSIFSELYNVLYNLRNSGEMGLNKKTKEFLDITNRANNFADQITFSVNSSVLPAIKNEDKGAKQDDQSQFNANLELSILGFNNSMNLELEKNKYVVMNEPCNYKNFNNQEASNDCISNRENKPKISDIQNLSTTLINQQVLLINGSLFDFMESNSNFWQELRYSLSYMLELSRQLKGK